MKTGVPVLFLIYNRPETTRQVFQRIREARPLRLYVAADGPRNEHSGDILKCEKARVIATQVDWECEVRTLYRDNNLGCRKAVSSAIDWFFDNEEMGIILEDDCLPNDSFFKFCEELLYKYRDEESVMTISGNNFQPYRRSENSYYFSKYLHCWGWATWRRAWNNFDINMKSWPLRQQEKYLDTIFSSQRASKYWSEIIDRVYFGEINSWAYIWQYSIWENNGVNILPNENLVSNIGFGEDGTHTKNTESDLANLDSVKLEFPLVHPSKILINKKADRYTQSYFIKPSLINLTIRKIKRVLSI